MASKDKEQSTSSWNLLSDEAALNQIRDLVNSSSMNPEQCRVRQELAKFASAVFLVTGQRLKEAGQVSNTSERQQNSDDEAVGIGLLLMMAAQLVSASGELLVDGRAYAGAALLRQVVEVEYLAWAFETRNKDAERWLRSDRQIREEFFRPAKLRQAANNRFRSRDYGFHCELGGHPVPQGALLLKNDEGAAQLLLSDLLGHAGRIWDHFVGWAHEHLPHGQIILADHPRMQWRFQEWQTIDAMIDLPPP